MILLRIACRSFATSIVMMRRLWILYSLLLLIIIPLIARALSWGGAVHSRRSSYQHGNRKGGRIYLKMNELDMDYIRDNSWMVDSNPVDYSEDDSNSYNKFTNLNQLGINVSDISKRKVIPIHNICGDDLFCNREINMNEVDAVGFDMDFTLAGYVLQKYLTIVGISDISSLIRIVDICI